MTPRPLRRPMLQAAAAPLAAAAAGVSIALVLGLEPARAHEASSQDPVAPEAAHHHMMDRARPVISLSAYGETRAQPDLAVVSIGVAVEAKTAQEAMAQNAERMNGLLGALRRAGVAERDIQTTSLSLSAQYTYRENQPPELRGYLAANQVTATVRDLARVGAAVDAAIQAGGNQINGISFGLRDPQAAEDAARVEAVRRLRAKAELYAKALGKRLGPLKTFSEGGPVYQPQPQPMYRMAMAEAAPPPPTPVAAGELSLRIDVNAVWELAD